MSIREIKDDIINLRGATVSIFGQSTKLSDSVDEGLVDILDVLDSLGHYEVSDDMLSYEDYNEENDEYELKTFENVDKYLDYMVDELGELTEVESGNSYNWSGNISNDFNYTIYKGIGTDSYYIEFSVHRFGDVRANYTTSALLEFRYVEEFYEAITEADKEVDLGNGCTGRVSALSNTIEVYDEKIDDYFEIYDIEDFKAKEVAEG